jgi:hypothetical protein
MDPEKAAQGISSYIDTFNAMSLKAGAGGFDHLVEEQTPGGMNERIIKAPLLPILLLRSYLNQLGGGSRMGHSLSQFQT